MKLSSAPTKRLKHLILIATALLLFNSFENVLMAQDTEPQDTSAVVADKMPEFPGGQEALLHYIAKHTRYPSDAYKKKIGGKVVVEFIVEPDGSIVDAKVKRHVYPSLDWEAVRVVRGMPKWRPGQLKGKDVRVRYSIPITFKAPAPF